MRHWVAVVCGVALTFGCGAELSGNDDAGDTGGDDTVVVDEWAVGQPGLAPIGPQGYGGGGSGIDAGSGTGGGPDGGATDGSNGSGGSDGGIGEGVDGGTDEDCDHQTDEDRDQHTDEHGKS